MRLSKPKLRLTTQERGGNAPSIARGFGRKCRLVRDSKKQACVGMTFQKGDRRWRPVAATCWAMCERTSPMFLIAVVAKFLCGTCGVTALGHRSSLGRLPLRINCDPHVRVCGGFTKSPSFYVTVRPTFPILHRFSYSVAWLRVRILLDPAPNFSLFR